MSCNAFGQDVHQSRDKKLKVSLLRGSFNGFPISFSGWHEHSSVCKHGQSICGCIIWAELQIVLALTAAQVTYADGPQGVHGITVPISSSMTPLATASIDLDPGEYFTRISVTNLTRTSFLVHQPVRLASLTLTTSKQVYGPFGVPTTDKPFEIQGPVYAFHGAVNRGDMTDILAAIGVWTLV